MKMPSLKSVESGLLYGAYMALSFPEKHKKLLLTFSAAAAGWAASGLLDRHNALHSLELQLQAKGQTEAVAKCMADVVAQSRPIYIDMVVMRNYKEILKHGHSLAATGAIAECVPNK